MAEQVQFRLEETLGELEKMQSIGLFNAQELRKITKRRKELLYKLQRRMKSKDNYLDYIEYEMNIYKLIKLRRRQLRITGKKTDIDHSIASRIHRIFKAVTFRHQSDTHLWNSFITFLKQMDWNDSVSRIYSRMLQVHSDKTAVWIEAAKWEMTENNAAESARTLMLRALRFHPKSKDLFLEYFGIELLYADRIRKRREVFGMDDENTETASDAIIKGRVAYAVFKNAMDTIKDVDFLLSFLAVCKQFNFTEELQDEIFKDIQDHYPTEESMWDYLATTHLIDSKQKLEKVAKELKMSPDAAITKSCTNCFEVLQTAVEVIPTEKMWTFYIEMCLKGVKKLLPKHYRTNHVYELSLKEALSALQEANSRSLLATKFYLEWISLLKDHAEDEVDEALLSAVEKHQSSVALWTMRLETMIRDGSQSSAIHRTFNEAINAVEDGESLPIWLLALQWARISSPDKVRDLYESGLVCNPEIAKVLKPMYLEYCALYYGAEDARKLYERLRYTTPICKEFFYKMLLIENAQLNPNIMRQRRIMEDITEHFGKTDITPWIDYINLEKTHPNGQEINIPKIHWRAMRTIDPELECRFTTAFTLISTNALVT